MGTPCQWTWTRWIQRAMQWTGAVEIAKQKAVSKVTSVEVNWKELCKTISYQSTVCGQNTLTRDFFSTLSSLCTHHTVAQGVARRVGIKHVHPHVITCLSVCCFLVLSSSLVSLVPPLSLSLLPVLCLELQLP